MSALSTIASVMWVWGCVAALLLVAPVLAFGRGLDRERRLEASGPALAIAWSIIALAVPATAAMNGFNWVTALLIASLPSVAVWSARHRHDWRGALRRVVRSGVLRCAIAAPPPFQWADTRALGRAAAPLIAIAAAAALIDVRLKAAADFDVLWRTRQLLEGTAVWDPVAALAAVATRVSVVNPLVSVVAVRVGVIAMTTAAVGQLITQTFGRRSLAIVVPLPVVLAVPAVPIVLWTVVLATVVGATTLMRWVHARPAEHRRQPIAAVLLALLQIGCLAHPTAFWRQAQQTAALEHPSAAREAMRLAKTSGEVDWMLAAPPEQALEIGGRGRHYDLAQFVSRFEGRVAQRDFRFALPVSRLFVMVEKEPLDVSRSVQGVEFIIAQPAAYRVASERTRLERAAWRLCDEYRRTHSGTSIVYDDVALRIYRFDL